MDNRIIRAINHYTRTEFKVDEEKEATDMCYAMQTSLDEARAEGIEHGVELGTERALQLVAENMLKANKTIGEIHDFTGLSTEIIMKLSKCDR